MRFESPRHYESAGLILRDPARGRTGGGKDGTMLRCGCRPRTWGAATDAASDAASDVACDKGLDAVLWALRPAGVGVT